jgi:soluble lytic murein transglycosylase-like protein
MQRHTPKLVLSAATLVVCSCAWAEDRDGTDMPHSSESRIESTPTELHRLHLTNSDDYRLKSSPEYRLQGRWGKPAQLPRANPPVLDPPFIMKLPYHDEVVAAARGAGLEPALIHAVIYVESAYNPAAVSPKGAVGLMQLMPDTARRYGVIDSKDPVQNIRGGTQYLTDLKRMFENDLALVLAAYNAGESAVLRSGRSIPGFPETLRYVPRVLKEYERLRDHLRFRF